MDVAVPGVEDVGDAQPRKAPKRGRNSFSLEMSRVPFSHPCSVEVGNITRSGLFFSMVKPSHS
jgi:hypothetical protein